MKIADQQTTSKIFMGRYLSTILFFIIIVLLSGNTATYDYVAYWNNYYGVMNSNFEAGYKFTTDLFFAIGLTFDQYKLVMLSLSLLLINQTAKKILPKYSLWIFYFFYFIYPLSLDAAHLRNTIAMAIVLYSIPYLSQENKISTIKFILLILLATLFHQTSVIYLFFIGIKLYVNKKVINKSLVKFCFTLLLLLSVAFTFTPQLFQNVLNLAANIIISNENISNQNTIYFNVTGNYGYLIFTAYQLFTIIILSYVWKNYKNETPIFSNLDKIKDIENLLKYVKYINICMLILVPFIRSNSNFFRLYRNLIPINHMLIISTVRLKNIKQAQCILIIIIYFFITLVFAYIIISPQRERLIDTMINDNWIINLLK